VDDDEYGDPRASSHTECPAQLAGRVAAFKGMMAKGFAIPAIHPDAMRRSNFSRKGNG
jgi:hypothetical protein